MADAEYNDLREKNNELVKAIQYWKMTAAQKEKEKLELMKEVNEWRLKFSRLKNADLANAKKLSAELQSASEKVLSLLVQASSVVATMLELTKSYVQGQQEIGSALPRWSSSSNTPTNEKVNRVPPLLIGGRHIQPVVSLSRTLQPNNSRTMLNRSLNQNNRTARAVPMHMLQDVFIPLTRIDAELPVSNVEVNVEENVADDSTEDLASDDSSERLDEQPSGQDDFDETPRLESVEEEADSEGDTAQRSMENPLEGPSWLLDVSARNTKRISQMPRNSEPDSTTELNDNAPSPEPSRNHLQVERPVSVTVACEFTPTVRRRKRASPLPPAPSPHFSPRPARRYSNSGRILKVMVAKMRLSDDEEGDGDASPPKRPNVGETQPKPQKIFQRRSPGSPKRESSSAKRRSHDGSPIWPVRDLTPTKRLMRFDAPSPNGSTDARVIVLEARNDQPEPRCIGVSRRRTLSRANSRENQPDPGNHTPSNSDHDNHSGNHKHTTQQQQHSNHVNRRTKTRKNQPDHCEHSENNHDTHSRSRDNRPANTRDDPPNHAHNNDSDNNHNNHSNGDRSSDQHNHTADVTNSNHDACNFVSDSRNSRANRSRLNSHNDNESDSSNSDAIGEGRTRRPRRAVVYKEKPLNRKLRR